jgi:uncharacterized Zn finger protein (UPF0148 family)
MKNTSSDVSSCCGMPVIVGKLGDVYCSKCDQDCTIVNPDPERD